MTEAEWLACTDPQKMLEFLRGKATDRKLRLFACACCRRVWYWLTDDRSRQAIIVAERFAETDRHADPRGYLPLKIELQEVWDAASASDELVLGNPLAWAIEYATWVSTRVVKTDQQVSERQAQAGLLRDIFCNPFGPSPTVPPAVLAWNDGTVRRLAEGVYEGRRLPDGALDPARLCIFADALTDAGCEDEAMIQHCRSAGPHVRGCWAVDLILGKE
jgi:hypothetical protein